MNVKNIIKSLNSHNKNPEPASKINIDSLHKASQKKEELKMKTFQRVLELCHNKIKLVADTNSLVCWFAVPEIMPGYPLYDIEECAEWLHDRLIQDKLSVDYFKPNLFLISWKVSSESNKNVQNKNYEDTDQNEN